MKLRMTWSILVKMVDNLIIWARAKYCYIASNKTCHNRRDKLLTPDCTIAEKFNLNCKIAEE